MDDEVSLNEIVRLERAVKALGEAMQPANSGNQSTVTINAGGVGVWIAVTASAIMLAVNMVLVVILIDHGRRIDDLQDYVHAIYMMAPQLKPEESK
jgi:hypothetical protein